MPRFDRDRLLVAWQEAVFALYLAEGRIEPEVVENMRTWNHNGLSVDQSVLLRAGDRTGIERLVQYMTRCPFSLSRLVKISESGQAFERALRDLGKHETIQKATKIRERDVRVRCPTQEHIHDLVAVRHKLNCTILAWGHRVR